ncbi:PREDICTED: NAC domain-containing protein 72-like [Ipomoea nil]|uniref:NAC domain-containing protein 72-like n=1 Tax=Ipomoea nil TaxID=35883 RepID=UPI00090146CE|nr:PREDICTED: NAC domain-containing protein 72-like [Ipomoea nil]
MGDVNKDTTSFALPGSGFYPSDEQLVGYYLSLKNDGDRHGGTNVIKDINLYNFDPFNLPETFRFRFGRGGRRLHWFCFVVRALKDRGTRRAGGGYWKRRGGVRVVVDRSLGKAVVGTRKCFVFYFGDSPKTAVRTDWFMYEYEQPNHPTAAFVLCRIFSKSHHGNNLSENMVSSCAEESVATVRHIGIQCNGTATSATDEKMQDEKNEVLNFPVDTVSKIDNHVSEPIGDQMRSTGLVSTGATFIEALAAEEELGILEGDFLELDDLVCPLLGGD